MSWIKKESGQWYKFDDDKVRNHKHARKKVDTRRHPPPASQVRLQRGHPRRAGWSRQLTTRLSSHSHSHTPPPRPPTPPTRPSTRVLICWAGGGQCGPLPCAGLRGEGGRDQEALRRRRLAHGLHLSVPSLPCRHRHRFYALLSSSACLPATSAPESDWLIRSGPRKGLQWP